MEHFGDKVNFLWGVVDLIRNAFTYQNRKGKRKNRSPYSTPNALNTASLGSA